MLRSTHALLRALSNSHRQTFAGACILGAFCAFAAPALAKGAGPSFGGWHRGPGMAQGSVHASRASHSDHTMQSHGGPGVFNVGRSGQPVHHRGWMSHGPQGHRFHGRAGYTQDGLYTPSQPAQQSSWAPSSVSYHRATTRGVQAYGAGSPLAFADMPASMGIALPPPSDPLILSLEGRRVVAHDGGRRVAHSGPHIITVGSRMSAGRTASVKSRRLTYDASQPDRGGPKIIVIRR